MSAAAVRSDLVEMERAVSRVVLSVHRRLHPGTRLHGPDHWARVREFGLELAAELAVPEEVPILFALLHDSCRHDDGIDRRHGFRAGQLFDRMLGAEVDDLDRLIDGLTPSTLEESVGRDVGGRVFLREARAALISLPKMSLRAVRKAVAVHTTADRADDPWVGLCLAADRLDRGRLHPLERIRPDLLPVEPARDPARIARCLRSGQRHERPQVLSALWGVD